MPILDRPPGLALCGAAPAYVPHGNVAANAASGALCSTAQAMAAVQEAHRGFAGGHDNLALAVQVAHAVTQALDGPGVGADFDAVLVPTSSRLPTLFGGLHPCP